LQKLAKPRLQVFIAAMSDNFCDFSQFFASDNSICSDIAAV
jgi:hypothetical protein